MDGWTGEGAHRWVGMPSHVMWLHYVAGGRRCLIQERPLFSLIPQRRIESRGYKATCTVLGSLGWGGGNRADTHECSCESSESQS